MSRPRPTRFPNYGVTNNNSSPPSYPTPFPSGQYNARPARQYQNARPANERAHSSSSVVSKDDFTNCMSTVNSHLNLLTQQVTLLYEKIQINEANLAMLRQNTTVHPVVTQPDEQ